METIYISSLEQLKSIKMDGSYVLKKDIDCKNEKVEYLAQIFRGKFDGNGHVISNLVLSSAIWTDGQILTLFQYLDNAIIENVRFSNLTIKVDLDGYKPKISALCHECMHSTIENVHMDVNLIGCNNVPMIDTAIKGKVDRISIRCKDKDLQKTLYVER